MQLHEKFGDAVHPIAFNIDFDEAEGEPSEELIQKVTAELTENNITCENLMASTPMEPLLEHFGIEIGVPVVLVFKDGNVVEKFEGGFSYEKEVHPAIERALAK